MTRHFGIAIAALIVAVACVPKESTSHRPRVPNKGELRARVNSLYDAETREDWRSWFQMTTIAHLKEGSYEEFLKESRGPEGAFPRSRKPTVVTARIQEISPLEPTGDHAAAEAAAAVKMYIVLEYPAGPIERITDQTDYWVYIDDDWYWTWRGWPHD